MRVVTSYQCEICEEVYDSPVLAQQCEALGLPAPMPFIPLDKPVPAFGESGVAWAKIRRVGVQRRLSSHEWWVATDPFIHVSHNLEGALVPAYAFDPRHGMDAFRYACSISDALVWQRTLADYGFTQGDASPWLAERIQQAASKLLGES